MNKGLIINAIGGFYSIDDGLTDTDNSWIQNFRKKLKGNNYNIHIRQLFIMNKMNKGKKDNYFH